MGIQLKHTTQLTSQLKSITAINISIPPSPIIMIIHNFAPHVLGKVGESMKVELPRQGLKLDPRVNDPHYARFSIDYHEDGITATLTRMNDVGYDGYHDDGDEFTMRAYDPETETVPDFHSTIYVYTGLDDERAPSDTTVVIIHPSVKIIQSLAFDDCKKLRRVIMNENVETIQWSAFHKCYSLDAVFLPSSIKQICHGAFFNCPSLRIISIPQTIDTDKIGSGIFSNCVTLFRIAQLPPYERNEGGRIINNDQVHQAMIDFNHDLPPLHKVCLHTNVTAQSIRQCITTQGPAAAYNTDYGDGMTPMHILALNPHADTDAILTLFHANVGVVFETYNKGQEFHNEQHSTIGGKTLLDCLSEYDVVDVDSYLSIIAALCRHREAHSSPMVDLIASPMVDLIAKLLSTIWRKQQWT